MWYKEPADLLHPLQRAERKMERRRRRMKKPTTPDADNHEPTSGPNAAIITEGKRRSMRCHNLMFKDTITHL